MKAQVKEFGYDKESVLVQLIMLAHTFIQWVNPSSEVFLKWERASESSRELWGITLGSTIWVPKGVGKEYNSIYGSAFILHELVHVRQMQRFIGPEWLRILCFWVAYLFLPIPTLLTFRGDTYELEAYTKEYRYLKHRGVSEVALSNWMDRTNKLFTTGAYLYMNPIGGGPLKKGSYVRTQLEENPATRPMLADLAEELYNDQAAKFASRDSSGS